MDGLKYLQLNFAEKWQSSMSGKMREKILHDKQLNNNRGTQLQHTGICNPSVKFQWSGLEQVWITDYTIVVPSYINISEKYFFSKVLK